MRSVQSSLAFPLAAVKPLERLEAYRVRCVDATRQALLDARITRRACAACGEALDQFGDLDGLAYGACRSCESVFLDPIPPADRWRQLLAEVNGFRHSPGAFHRDIAQSRADTVYGPKLEWLRSTLRIHGVRAPRVIDATTPPSDFTAMLRASGMFAAVDEADEMAPTPGAAEGADVVVLLESVDRVADPSALLRWASARLVPGGFVFLTALVRSGFDLAVLQFHNRYLYPPDRANCFTLAALQRLVTTAGFTLVEVSTPGVLDVQIVEAHLRGDATLPLSRFERQLMEATPETRAAFQAFLQEHRLSSFARLVGRKP